MKIVVSTIMKDETPEFIERWVKSAMDADEVVLVDTGSTNNAVECAKDLGVVVHQIRIYPWRFDTARNAAMSLLPADADLVVKLDVDEVLVAGWRDALEDAGLGGRYSYDYIWNFTPDGEPDIKFAADHTISRFGWQWRHPAHEALYWVGASPLPQTIYVPGMVIEHRSDPTKSRAQYLDLLALAVKEDPLDDRMSHYYARELYFRGDWVSAREEFMRHLTLPTARWAAERAQSYRYLAKMDDFPERWLLKAAAEAPDRREPWVDLAEHWMVEGQPQIASGFAMRAMTITGQYGDYISEASAWDDETLRRIANQD